MAEVKFRAASVYFGGKKNAEVNENTVTVNGNDEAQFGDPGFVGYSDGATTTTLSITEIQPVAGGSVDLMTAFLNKQSVDVMFFPIKGKVVTVTMRILEFEVKSEQKNGTQTGTFKFGGGQPQLASP